MPVHRSLDYYTQLQKELEMEKMCSADTDHALNSHYSRPSDTQSRPSDAFGRPSDVHSRTAVNDGEGAGQAHKFRVHKLNKVASPVSSTSKD